MKFSILNYIFKGCKNTYHNSVLKKMGSGMSVTTQEKSLEFIIDNSMNTSVQYLPKHQVSVRIN